MKRKLGKCCYGVFLPMLSYEIIQKRSTLFPKALGAGGKGGVYHRVENKKAWFYLE